MFRKGAFTLLLTLALVLGIAAASYAGPGKGKENWKFNGQGKWKAIQLKDINSHWAEEPIRAMGLQGIVLGYPDFTFRPNAPVTRYEALMMISKASGFDGTMDAEGSWDSSVPLWMRGCLDYAVDRGILSESEAESLKGWEPAKRYEVAVWAVRAMNLGLDERLSFGDLEEIPVYARPYVGGMFRYRYMVGYPGNIFQPNKPVTRGELAAVLYRIMLEHPADNAVCKVVKGEVDELDDDSIEIGGKTYEITEDTDIFVNGKRAGLDDLEEDAWVTAFVDSGERVVLICARDDDDEDEDEDDGDTGGTFGIEALSPKDGSSVYTETKVLKARFSGDVEVVSGKDLLEAVEVYNKSDKENVDIDKVEVDGDTLVITLESYLEGGDTFEVTVESGYLKDKDTGEVFEGIDGEDWSFTTRY